MVGEEVPRRDPSHPDPRPARGIACSHSRAGPRRPHARPPGDGPPGRCRLDGAAHRPPPRYPRADGSQVREGVPGRGLRRPPRSSPPRAPAHGHRGPPRRPGGAARRRGTHLDDAAVGRLAGAGARGPGPSRPPQPRAARPPLWLEAHRGLGGPQAARPRRVRRQGRGTR